MLRNPLLANKEIGTVFGAIKFDAQGECRQLKAEEEKLFEKIRGFEVVVEKTVEEVKEKVAPKGKTKPAPKSEEEK